MTSELVSHVILPEAPDPNLQQRLASSPEDMVWVSASAGSGKTTILTNRVLRLLLPDPSGQYPGTPPRRLLCITYTKAAAAEMALRVQKNLSDWAIIPEADLFKRLADLTGQNPDAAMIAAARKLFAEVLEAPGGLNLLTIHSFCQSVLGRFPLEAGVPPGFSVLDEAQAKDLFGLALEETLARSQTSQENDVSTAFRHLAPFLQLDDLRSSIRNVLRYPEYLEKSLTGQKTFKDLTSELKVGLGLDKDATPTLLTKSFVGNTPIADLRLMIEALLKSTKTLQDMSAKIQDWLDLSNIDRGAHLDIYQDVLLTSTGLPRSLGKLETKDPVTFRIMKSETDRLLTYHDKLKKIIQSEATSALMILSRSILQDYETRKKIMGSLDYDDLIRKTDDLLTRTSGKWVHYKLDGGIDHILMDEAQDTNPRQWNIIKNLSKEIFEGAGRASDRPRTIFVVGDEKQSIFSFQGADPISFDKMRSYFDKRSSESDRKFARVPLEVSFRSTPPILGLVDRVFSTPTLREQIGLSPEQGLRHFSRRNGDSGLVELWPLYIKPQKPNLTQWALPFDRNNTQSPNSLLSEQIAQEIWGWIQKKELLASQGRPIEAGDILILVRTRNALVRDLIRHLKRRGLPVSGIDRLILSDQIGIQDLLALARFARLEADDFSLACVLRSPLIGLTEDDLMSVALQRSGKTLWQTLQERASPEIVVWLKNLTRIASTAAPFEFFEDILNRPCPGCPQGTGWLAMTQRLGEDVVDPLEELMSLCLRLESQGIRTLESLLLWQQKTPVEIKRQMEEAGSQIRIMTVHASKGLEAPIVILPDTTSVPQRKTADRFLWPEKSDLPIPLWSPNTANECQIFSRARNLLHHDQKAEYARLLYVALTRARDRLYIMGIEGAETQAADTWYAHIEAAFNQLSDTETLENGRRRWSTAQKVPPRDQRPAPPKISFPDIPSWVSSSPRPETASPEEFSPSQAENAHLTSQSPIDIAQPYRYRRGTLTHRLLQLLPDMPIASRKAAADHYIKKNAQDLPEQIQQAIVLETLAVLADPTFSAVFGPGSMAEVPVTGRLLDGRIINGQIDRLVILDNTVLIVDYKTNRPSPRTVAEIPDIYLSQLRSYRDALTLIYPNHLINCALLWTDQPLLMPVTI